MNFIFIPSVSFAVAFLAGLFSFISPCVFPLIPSYLSYVSGFSMDELLKDNPKAKFTVVKHSLMFIFGFTIIFVLLGAFSSAVGNLLHSIWIMRIAGLFIIIMGLFIIGAFNNLKFLSFMNRDAAVNIKNKPFGLIGSALVGVVFAAAWTPCIGPILASILFIASTAHNIVLGMELLFTYAMGLAVPFFISAVSLNLFFTAFKRFKKYIRTIQIISGVILIAVGILIFFNYLTVISFYFAGVLHYNIPYNG